MTENSTAATKQRRSSKNRTRGLVFLSLVLVGIGYFLSITYPTKYEATATIRVETDLAFPKSGRNPAMLNHPNPGVQRMHDKFWSSQIDSVVFTLHTTSLTAQVIQDHDLMNHTEFTNAVPLGDLANRLTASTTIQRRTDTELFDISVTHRSKRLTPDLANWIAQGLIQQHAKNQARSDQLATSVLTNEAHRLKLKLRNAEAALIDYRKSSGLMMPLEEKTDLLMTQIGELSNTLTSLDQEISALKNNPRDSDDELSRLTRKKADLTSQLQSAEEESFALSPIAVEYNVLLREIEMTAALYDKVLDRIKKVGTSTHPQPNPISIVEEADSAVRLSPHRALITFLPLAIVLGIGLISLGLLNLFGLGKH